MPKRPVLLLLLIFLLCFFPFAIPASSAQGLSLVTRFYPVQGKYDFYADGLLSGFMQYASPVSQGTASGAEREGFLQMPFTGNPLLIYIGEKDSTQFTAYASAYHFRSRTPVSYDVDIARYGIRAQLAVHADYVQHTYTFPDTLADKGFLIDLDHALRPDSMRDDDIDVQLIDHFHVRAWRKDRAGRKSLYYVAAFSHRLDTWNVRRERVVLSNGQKASRVKVAFTFKLAKGEALQVRSAVSEVSSSAAYLAACGQRANAPLQDLPATAAVSRQRETCTPPRTSATKSAAPAPNLPASSNVIEIATRDALVRTAFEAAWNQACKRVLKKGERPDALTTLWRMCRLYPSRIYTAAQTDSARWRYAEALFKGNADGKADNAEASQANGALSSDSLAAWYVFTTLGLLPAPSEQVENETGSERYFLVECPAVNVSVLSLPRGRSLRIYLRRATKQRRAIKSVKLGGETFPVSPEKPVRFSFEELSRGGLLEVVATH